MFNWINNIFPNARQLLISLGEDGAILFHSEYRSKALWVFGKKFPEISTLGCGDSARAGFISALLDSLPNEHFLSHGEFSETGASGQSLRRFCALGFLKSQFLDFGACLGFVEQQLGASKEPGDSSRASSRDRDDLTDRLCRDASITVVAISERPSAVVQSELERRSRRLNEWVHSKQFQSLPVL